MPIIIAMPMMLKADCFSSSSSAKAIDKVMRPFLSAVLRGLLRIAATK